MILIQIAQTQHPWQQKASPIPLQPAIDSPDDRAKFHEILYDSQLEGGQHIIQIKMAEALSRILEAYFLERQWLL